MFKVLSQQNLLEINGGAVTQSSDGGGNPWAQIPSRPPIVTYEKKYELSLNVQVDLTNPKAPVTTVTTPVGVIKFTGQ